MVPSPLLDGAAGAPVPSTGIEPVCCRAGSYHLCMSAISPAWLISRSLFLFDKLAMSVFTVPIGAGAALTFLLGFGLLEFIGC